MLRELAQGDVYMKMHYSAQGAQGRNGEGTRKRAAVTRTGSKSI
jgi:hypothetical protein